MLYISFIYIYIIEHIFFSGVRQFFEAATQKMILKFPFEDQVLKDLVVVNPADGIRAELDFQTSKINGNLHVHTVHGSSL